LEGQNEIFVESIDRGIWDAIVNVPFVPKAKKDYVFIEKPWFHWTESESKELNMIVLLKTSSHLL